MLATLMQGAAVLVGMTILDFVWARYTAACAEKKAMLASLNASGIMILNGLVTIVYVNEPRMIVPAVVGAFIGTYLSIWMSNR